MGAKSAKARNDGAQKLIDYGFDNFETHKLYRRGRRAQRRTRLGRPTRDPPALGLARDLYVTIPRGRYDAARREDGRDGDARRAARPRVPPVGEVQVSLDGTPVSILPLVALQPVIEGGAWTKLVDELRLGS